MTRAIVWKEWREQGLIAFMLVVLGAGILVAAATLADPPAAGAIPSDVVRYLGVGRLATLLLAVTSGMVCGGALFAAEREAGTFGFLESLPASRLRLWVAKLAAGLALAMAQISVVLAVAGGLGQVGTVGFAVAVGVYALLAFAWGALGSTLTRTTLGSVGVAIPAATVAALVFLFPIMLVFAQPGAGWPRPSGALVFIGLMLITPLGLSALVFTRPDRERSADDIGIAGWQARSASAGPPVVPDRFSARPSPGRPRLGFRALFWLTTRQILPPLLVGSGFAVAAGLVLLLPTVHPILAWPILGLAAGVLAGVTAFGDEQGHGTGRFWGERRLPLGRVWGVKVLAHAAFAIWLVVLVALPGVIRTAVDFGSPSGRAQSLLSGVFRSLLFNELSTQGWKFVFVPVAYGFAAGHLCGLVFRKAVVAAGVAGLTGGTAAALWLPSLLAGGVWHWQVWLPPTVALGTARLLIRPWAADRLTARGPLVALVAGLGAVAFVQGAGIAYRVVEVPDHPGGEDDLAFINRLPDFSENESGRAFRAAADRFSKVAAEVTPPFDRQSVVQRRPRLEDRLEGVIQTGWPANDPELGEWLDALYAQDRPAPGTDERVWAILAREAAGRPVGMYEDPRLYTGPPAMAGMENARRMALVVLARGLQRQARDGDHAAFVDDYRTAVALARSLRNRSVVAATHLGHMVERHAVYAAYQWVKLLPAGPEPAARAEVAGLLARLLAANSEPDPLAPFDPTPHLLAERYFVRGQMAAPGQWLPDQITANGRDKESTATESDLVGFAWTVPWERERTRRLVGLVFTADGQYRPLPAIRGRPGAQWLILRTAAVADLTETDRVSRVLRRAVAVIAAVRAYQSRDPNGKPPPTLAALVAAGYLPVAPPDPFDGQPLRYRVSAGESLSSPRVMVTGGGPGRTLEPPPAIPVPAGQVIVWSVGPDKTDQGGRHLPVLPGGYPRQEDWVFLVPQ